VRFSGISVWGGTCPCWLPVCRLVCMPVQPAWVCLSDIVDSLLVYLYPYITSLAMNEGKSSVNLEYLWEREEI